MPPSHHSSSHHSSSHHSSSHHSSSHHSSGSYRTSYSGSFGFGPSRHSTTTRTQGSSFGHVSYRNRTNQPTGFNKSSGGSSGSVLKHCRKHDYMYYPISWVDEDTGKSYKKGYYDENGNHYDNIAFKVNGKYEYIFECEYCGTTIKSKWEDEVAPTCPNCSAPLDFSNIITDEEVNEAVAADGEYVRDYSYGNTTSAIFSKVKIWLVIFVVMSIISSAISAIEGRNSSYNDSSYSYGYDSEYGTTDVQGYTNNPVTFGEEIYVDALGRSCEWSYEYDNYYDPETDCYFWFNGDQETGGWQYWYEGISSEYSSGWMEYDYVDECWYIETYEGNWKVLPNKYNSSRLWHF